MAGLVIVVQGDKATPLQIENYAEEALRQALLTIRSMSEAEFRNRTNGIITNLGLFSSDMKKNSISIVSFLEE